MIGPHVQAFRPGVLDWVLRSRPRWLKTMHPERGALGEIKRQFPQCRVWYRRFFPAQLLDDPVRRAHEAAEAVLVDLRDCRQYVEWVSSYNETGLFEQAEQYRDFEAEYARVMRAEGLKVVSYNFSVGQPPIGDWPRYLPIPGDALGLNQYNAPMLDSPGADWSLLRHVRAREATGYTGPILIGETGIDRGVLGEGLAGWRASGISVSEYCRQLIWAAEQFRQSGVTAAFLFNAGGWGWESFEVANENAIADTLARLNWGQPQHPPGGTMPEFQVGPGVAAEMARRGDTPLTDERWIGDWLSVTLGQQAEYHYHKQANRVVVLLKVN